MERVLSYAAAIQEATDQEMERDSRVIVLGLGVDDPKAILSTTRGLQAKYGSERVFDTPLSEDAMTGVAIGASMAGLRPIHVHIRMDFLTLAMNQLVNMAAKMRYMSGGQISVPLVVRSMIGKSWGQGAQHSQALYSLFAHIPGLKVVAPTTPYDAKGCLAAAIRDDNPVLCVEHRLLYYQHGPVPEYRYTVPPGQARLAARGHDITLVGISYMQIECLRAQRELQKVGIHAEVIDPIWLSPLDLGTIVESVRKTRRLLVVDNAWKSCSVGATIAAAVVERLQDEQRSQVQLMGFEPVTCPPAPSLEELFYPNGRTIAATAHRMVCGSSESWCPDRCEYPELVAFKGPF